MHVPKVWFIAIGIIAFIFLIFHHIWWHEEND